MSLKSERGRYFHNQRRAQQIAHVLSLLPQPKYVFPTMSDSDSDDISDLLPNRFGATRGSTAVGAAGGRTSLSMLGTAAAAAPSNSKKELPALGRLKPLAPSAAASSTTTGSKQASPVISAAPQTTVKPPAVAVGGDDDDSDDIEFLPDGSSTPAASPSRLPAVAPTTAPLTKPGHVADAVQKFERQDQPLASTSSARDPPTAVAVPAVVSKFESHQRAGGEGHGPSTTSASSNESQKRGGAVSQPQQPDETPELPADGRKAEIAITEPKRAPPVPPPNVALVAAADRNVDLSPPPPPPVLATAAPTPVEPSPLEPALRAPVLPPLAVPVASSGGPGESAGAQDGVAHLLQRVNDRLVARESLLASSRCGTPRAPSPYPSDPNNGPPSSRLSVADGGLSTPLRPGQGSMLNAPPPGGALPGRHSGDVSFGPHYGAVAAAASSTQQQNHVDAASRERLIKENVRLTEEASVLAAALAKAKSQQTNVSSTSEVERARLSVEAERLREQLQESREEVSRLRHAIQVRARESEQHQEQLLGEIETLTVTTSQLESVLAEKEGQLAHERALVDRLKDDLRDKHLDVQRLRDEGARQREDDANRVDRVTSLLEDAKRQRAQLLELTDRLTREKDAIAMEKRQFEGAHRALQKDISEMKERSAQDLATLTRDMERQRGAYSEKERHLQAQVQEERRAKETAMQRAAEREEQLTRDTNSRTTKDASLLANLRDEVARLQQANTEMTSELADSRAQLAAALEDRQRAQVQAAENADAASRVASLTEELRSRDHQLRSDHDDHMKLQQRALAQQRDIEALRDAVAASQIDKDRADQRAADVARRLEELLSSDDHVLSENTLLRQELDRVAVEDDALRRELGSAQLSLEQLNDLCAENERLNAECQRLAEERASLVRDNQRLQDDVLTYRAELQSLYVAGGSSSGVSVAAPAHFSERSRSAPRKAGTTLEPAGPLRAPATTSAAGGARLTTLRTSIGSRGATTTVPPYATGAKVFF